MREAFFAIHGKTEAYGRASLKAELRGYELEASFNILLRQDDVFEYLVDALSDLSFNIGSVSADYDDLDPFLSFQVYDADLSIGEMLGLGSIVNWETSSQLRDSLDALIFDKLKASEAKSLDSYRDELTEDLILFSVNSSPISWR